MRILVLGAGVVGVVTAYYLARDGHQVVVIDRQSGPGLETSFANAGLISGGRQEPWAGPGTPWKVLKWLGREDAPLVMRPSLDPALWAWCFRFLGNCTTERSRINGERMVRITRYSQSCLAEIREATNIDYDAIYTGIMRLYFDRETFNRAASATPETDDDDHPLEILDAQGCVEREPALAAVGDTIAGSLYWAGDEGGDAYKFTTLLADVCAGMGVQFRYRTTIRRFLAGRDRILGVVTDGGTLNSEDYDAFVLAAGSYSPGLLKSIGVSLPVYPAKGYSVTLPVAGHGGAPSIPVIHEERKFIVTRFGDRVRAAGTAELTGYDTRLRERRAQSLLDQARNLFPDLGDFEKAEFWCGLRPQTPDSVPVIGGLWIENLFLNTGHSANGWANCAASGQIVADVIGAKTPDIDLDGFGIERFG